MILSSSIDKNISVLTGKQYFIFWQEWNIYKLRLDETDC